MKVIGFTAQMGAGKSTAIEFIRAREKYPVSNVKFAQALYDMQEFIYNRISSVHKKPDDFVKDRKLLQWLGTDWGRDTISKTLWVDIWKARVKQLMIEHPNDVVVCDDVRFDNEADAIHAMGGVIVQINCDARDKRIDTKAGLVHHSSESGINPKLVDYTVANNGTLGEFQIAVRNLYGLIDFKERNLK